MQFTGTSVIVLAAVASAVWAAPTNTYYNNAYDYNSELAEFYARVSEYINDLPAGVTATSCDVSKVTLPTAASSMPAPTGTLKHVAIGRGTQNYTCADSTADTKPSQIGALASLYDASCLAANYPDLLDSATNIVLNYDLASLTSDVPGTPLPPANLDLLGHHYFEDTTTPVFNLDTTTESQLGIAISKKNASMNAPTGSVVGQDNTGNGACPWLYLTTIAGTVGDYVQVYRVNTAGGAAPTTCEGQPESFQIQYSGQYYFYV